MKQISKLAVMVLVAAALSLLSGCAVVAWTVGHH